jgi:glucoamylase
LVFKSLIDQYIYHLLGSSLSINALFIRYTNGEDDSLRDLIDDFVAAQAIQQQIPNSSGNVTTGGLGDPKFYANLTADFEPWGR